MSETKVITNFSGKLTRLNTGDLNSGYAQFNNSYGYDPFTNPTNLIWYEDPVQIDSSASVIQDLILCSKERVESGVIYTYALGHTGRLYKLQPNGTLNSPADTFSLVATLTQGSPTFVYGASMEFYGATEKIYISSDDSINSINFDGSGEALVASGGDVVANTFHPLKQFAGFLIYGNGTNIGEIDSTATVVSNAVLSPGFPPEVVCHDLDVTPDFSYLVITASTIPTEPIMTALNDRPIAGSGAGYIFKWNGTDVGVTSGLQLPSLSITALETYLQNEYFFSQDTFGSALNIPSGKLLTLQNFKSPFANSVISNGNFISAVSPETFIDPFAVTSRNASMLYYGALDQDSAPGLYRLFSIQSSQGGTIYQTPYNSLITNSYYTTGNSYNNIVAAGYGKHYFSVWDITAGPTSKYKLYRFLLTPTGTGTVTLGNYRTQLELFSKRKVVKQVRVYTEPTVSGNGFQIAMIGSDGRRLNPDVQSYTYAAGTDITKLQGSLERINFNFTMTPTYAIGLQITNTGTTNMTFLKVELDIDDFGK